MACTAASMVAVLGLVPVAVQSMSSPAAAQTSNCSASTSGQTQLNESAFTASVADMSAATGVQVPITQAQSHTDSSRFTSGAAQAVGMTYEVNMGSAQTFDEVDMYVPDYSGDYPRGFNVNVSTNGSTWTTVASCTATAQPTIVSFTGVTDQYLEVVLTASTSPSWWSIEQFLIYNGSTTTTTTTSGTTTTATTAPTTTTTSASGANCSASLTSEEGFSESGFKATSPTPSTSSGAQDPITNEVNGNDAAGRFTTGADQAVGDDYVVNMGTAQTFNEIEMSSPDYANDYARGYEVEVSANGTSWTVVASCTGTATPEIVSFPQQTEQYVEVVLTAANASYWWSMEYFYTLVTTVGNTGTQTFPSTSSTTTTTTKPTTTSTSTTTTTTKPTTTTTTATSANCSASTTGESQLTESGFTATAPTPGGTTGAQNPITNVVNGNDGAGRFTTNADQAVGDDYIVNMGAAKSFNEIEMAVPDYATDYAHGYNVEVSANDSTWTVVASCTGTGTPEIVSFAAQSDQYVEVVLTAANAAYWWSMEYFYVFTTSSTTTTASTTTTTASTTTTTTCSTCTSYGGFPSSFWGNTSAIPTSTNGIEFNFLNETGIAGDPTGSFPSSEVYWDVNGTEESIAAEPYYNMVSCASCRIYFYVGSPSSAYNDFIELNSSGTTINADTSRVDAMALPLAIHLHNSNSTDTVVGEDYQVFDETRSALFTQFEDAVPAVFQQLATVDAPYYIPAPGDVAAFQPGGADANYMVAYAASVGATETTQEVFGCAGGGSPALNGDPSLCAGLNRCVAQFSTTVQDTPSDYYQNPPCNYYSWFWHSVAVNGLQYGFAYDDDNGQSSDFNSTDAQYVQVAVGW